MGVGKVISDTRIDSLRVDEWLYLTIEILGIQ